MSFDRWQCIQFVILLCRYRWNLILVYVFVCAKCQRVIAKDAEAASACKRLLSAGADVNALNVHGEVPLHMAARRVSGYP